MSCRRCSSKIRPTLSTFAQQVTTWIVVIFLFCKRLIYLGSQTPAQALHKMTFVARAHAALRVKSALRDAMRERLLNRRKFRFENVRDKHDETNAATLQRKEADPTANQGELRGITRHPKRGKRLPQMG
jgi:hypothetical protein